MSSSETVRYSGTSSQAGGAVQNVGPLRAVMTAFKEGATSVADVAVRADLSEEVTRASIDHLIRLGRIDARQLAAGCPTGGCSSCASGRGDTPGCGATGPSEARTGPVLVTLSLRPGHRNAENVMQ